MELFQGVEFDGHEQVVFASEPETGLRAIIAIHDTRLGPAIGGCRVWRYPDEDSALRDVLRLSRGMTYKTAMANVPLGGGKSVILLAPGQKKDRELMLSMGKAIDRLGGRYIAGEDIGSTSEDMGTMLTVTRHALGAPEGAGGSGDLSPMTALGCLVGITVSVRRRFGAERLRGLRVAVQGLGKVGGTLCGLLHAAGCALVVADVDRARVDAAVNAYHAAVAAPERIHEADVDVFAPCALGGGLNDTTIPEIRAGVVAGAANNQLLTADHGAALKERDVLYAPDYIINAGGMIQLAVERARGDREETERRVRQVGETLDDVFDLAQTEDIPTNVAADRLAQRRLRGEPGPSRRDR